MSFQAPSIEHGFRTRFLPKSIVLDTEKVLKFKNEISSIFSSGVPGAAAPSIVKMGFHSCEHYSFSKIVYTSGTKIVHVRNMYTLLKMRFSKNTYTATSSY